MIILPGTESRLGAQDEIRGVLLARLGRAVLRVAPSVVAYSAMRFARLLMDFIKNTDPAEFEFSDEDLALLRERMLARAKRSR